MAGPAGPSTTALFVSLPSSVVQREKANELEQHSIGHDETMDTGD